MRFGYDDFASLVEGLERLNEGTLEEKIEQAEATVRGYSEHLTRNGISVETQRKLFEEFWTHHATLVPRAFREGFLTQAYETIDKVLGEEE